MDALLSWLRGSGEGAWIDRRALALYVFLGLAGAADVAAISAMHFTLGHSSLPRRACWLLFLLALAVLARRVRFARLATILEAISLPLVAGALTVVGTIVLGAVSRPLIDPQLNAADGKLGFDFLTVLAFYSRYPLIAAASRWAYVSFSLQIAIVPFGLALSSDRARLWVFLYGWVLSCAVCVAAFPLAAAAGEFDYRGIPEGFSGILFPSGQGEIIAGLRNGSIREISHAAHGLVSIPSFHAAAAVMFGWAAWRSWFRWPMLILNAAMISSTIVYGSHYLVDVIAGLALAAGALAVAGVYVSALTDAGHRRAAALTTGGLGFRCQPPEPRTARF